MMKNNFTTKALFNKIDKKLFCSSSLLFSDKIDDIEELDNNSETSSSEDNINIEYKNTYYKNDLRKQVLKQNFDKDKIFINDNIITEQDKINKEIVGIHDERKQLNFDFQSIGLAIKALFKMNINKTPNKKEFDAYGHIQKNYDSFLEENTIDDMKNVRSYIKDELQANKFRLKELDKNFNEKSLISSDKRKLDDMSEGEESSSSKKSRKTDSDYLDELPYNPFDDIGTD